MFAECAQKQLAASESVRMPAHARAAGLLPTNALARRRPAGLVYAGFAVSVVLYINYVSVFKELK